MLLLSAGWSGAMVPETALGRHWQAKNDLMRELFCPGNAPLQKQGSAFGAQCKSSVSIPSSLLDTTTMLKHHHHAMGGLDKLSIITVCVTMLAWHVEEEYRWARVTVFLISVKYILSHRNCSNCKSSAWKFVTSQGEVSQLYFRLVFILCGWQIS